ncbi:MAG: alpha/beta hydrolase [Pseudomonadota bacterium]
MNIRALTIPSIMITLFGASAITYAKSSDTTKKTPIGIPSKPDKDMQTVLDALKALHGKPIEKLTPAEARLQPTPTDAVKKVLVKQGKPTTPLAIASVKDVSIPNPNGPIPAHIYTPEGAGPFPVIVYFHGGGFVLADTKVYDASIRELANNTQAIVVSVDYHSAPEDKFPTQPNEAYRAFKWALVHANEFNGDAKRVAVAGESAGGNLAAVVSLMARDKKETMPIHELLIYPVVDNDMKNSSYRKYANAKPLNAAMMKWFFSHYIFQPSEANSLYAFPNKASSLKGLPPTTIITAEIDPLFTEGEKFANRLQQEGVPVAYKHYTGVTHEFFGMGSVVAKAREAQQFAAEELKKSFNTTQ